MRRVLRCRRRLEEMGCAVGACQHEVCERAPDIDADPFHRRKILEGTVAEATGETSNTDSPRLSLAAQPRSACAAAITPGGAAAPESS